MSFIDNTPDKWINFVLQNGWRLNAQVDEETGDLSIAISNEKGNVNNGSYSHEAEEVKEIYTLIPNEESK
jgi:hypothetical protein|tara:strand:+ start:122 stop:331 length:210 start_codon:yes stop_codon:yes gene_type:complete